MCVASVGGRHPGSAMRTPFTRPPRNRSWRPSSPCAGAGKSARTTARRRRQGCQRRQGFRFSHGGRKRHRVTIVLAPKWGPRREARFSPASFASGGPELPGARFTCLWTGGAARERDVRVDGHGAARLWDESNPRAIRRKASHGLGCCAGKRRSTSARVGTVSECRSRSDASPVATPAGATKRISDTRDLARRNRLHRG